MTSTDEGQDGGDAASATDPEPTAGRPDIRRYLEVSTSHVPEHIISRHDRLKGVLAWPHDLGLFVDVPDSPAELDQMALEGASPELMVVVRYAVGLGCSLIELRNDIEPNGDLPVYDQEWPGGRGPTSQGPPFSGSPPPPFGPAPPGWYQDPWRIARMRWWDGSTWTAHTS